MELGVKSPKIAYRFMRGRTLFSGDVARVPAHILGWGGLCCISGISVLAAWLCLSPARAERRPLGRLGAVLVEKAGQRQCRAEVPLNSRRLVNWIGFMGMDVASVAEARRLSRAVHIPRPRLNFSANQELA